MPKVRCALGASSTSLLGLMDRESDIGTRSCVLNPPSDIAKGMPTILLILTGA
jgi:hypothetical protein